MKAAQAWQAAVGQLQMEMPKAAFETWVKNADFLSYEDGSFTIGVQNAYARDWLESRLSSTVSRLLIGTMNRTVEVRFVVWNNSENCDSPPVNTEESQTFTLEKSNPTINSRYTFTSFVVGNSNRLAHAASVAVAENPSQSYNPLFLYGGVGLGKTHLLHAIGNHCAQSGLSVLYVSSEEFTNDLINAIRNHTTQGFREKYRRIDVLLIDDIQFIAGKESTQEEFFHTFNTLHGQDKQIVMTSDRPPKAMVTLEERLRSRFEWGLTADIQPPDYETRIAILRSKAERKSYAVPDEIIEIIARKFQSNIRELEGALIRIVAYADLRGMAMTPQLIDFALADLLHHRKKISPEYIIKTIADSYGLPIEKLTGRGRTNQVVLPRQVAMYLLREEANISLPQIGQALGGRDHTTIMYGCDKISDLMERDDSLKRKVIEIKEELYKQTRINI